MPVYALFLVSILSWVGTRRGPLDGTEDPPMVMLFQRFLRRPGKTRRVELEVS